MKLFSIVVVLASLATPATAAAPAPANGTLVIDEHVWVVFYDVPSRRFRTARDAFLRREFDVAARELIVSARHVGIAAQLAADVGLGNALAGSAEALERLAGRLSDDAVTLRTLDELFAQTHWRLTQLYLALARAARERREDRLTGQYLLASAHHMERAVLWSNRRVEARDASAVDAVRDAARRLAAGEPWANYRSARPIKQLEEVLERTGQQINRPLLIESG